MKRHLLYFPVLLLCLVACAAGPQARLPELTDVAGGQEKDACSTVFPKGKWQFVHAIDFVMGERSGTPVVGVTSLAKDGIDCALITVEGLTLFEAAFRHDGSIEVRRAVPPFDGPDFAKGLIGDIRAIFQAPTGSMTVGQVAGKTAVCRYIDNGREVVDVLPDVEDCWQIRSYTADLVLDRSIVGRSCKKKGSSLIPEYLELKTYGKTGYTLKMTLITADKIK
jgi:hypothetical protein